MHKHTSVIHGLNVNKTVKCTSIQAGQRVVTKIKGGQGSKTVEGARLNHGDGVKVEAAVHVQRSKQEQRLTPKVTRTECAVM